MPQCQPALFFRHSPITNYGSNVDIALQAMDKWIEGHLSFEKYLNELLVNVATLPWAKWYFP
jgi:hypothetical protein